jgi:hypothetical protein
MPTRQLRQPAASQDHQPLRFERRQSDRWRLDGVATAFELGGEAFGRMHTLRMLDYSDGGVGAQCDSVLPPGTPVSIGFQSPGYIARRGVVTRCRPCGEGYRIAIEFEQRLAA